MDLTALIDQQSSTGAFPSFIATDQKTINDENCFITALVTLQLMALASEYKNEALRESIDRALDFIASCESKQMPGAFVFYPSNHSQKILATRLAPDCDDTALALLALLKGNRKSKEDLIGICRRTILSHQKKALLGREAPWIKRGLIFTWLEQAPSDNPIDLIANVNVAGLLAYLGLKDHSAYRAIVESLDIAIKQTSGKLAFMRRLAPYYAHSMELWFALQRAIAQGAKELLPSFTLFKAKNPTLPKSVSPELPICCNVHGRPLWYAPVLQKLRLSTIKI